MNSVTINIPLSNDEVPDLRESIGRGRRDQDFVHPDYQKKGIGVQLVRSLLQEFERVGLEIITVSYEEKSRNFYQTCGFSTSLGGVWEK